MEREFIDERNKLETLIEIANKSGLERHKKLVELQEMFLVGFLSCLKFNALNEEYKNYERGYILVTKLKHW